MTKPRLTLNALLSFTLGSLALCSLGSTALADTYIRGTQASYKLKITDKKVNESSVYIDEANDTTNDNYMQFACEDGAPTFYLHSGQKLYTQKQYDDETTPDIQVKVDGGRPLSFTTVSADTEDKPDLMTLAVTDKFDAQMLRIFQTAQKNVIISVPTANKKSLSFTFYPKGFTQAFSKINLCQ